MYPNIVTNTVFKSGMIPFVVPTDKEAIQLCIRTTNGVDRDPAKVRVVRIPNTSHIGTVMLSESYYEAVKPGSTLIWKPWMNRKPEIRCSRDPADKI